MVFCGAGVPPAAGIRSGERFPGVIIPMFTESLPVSAPSDNAWALAVDSQSTLEFPTLLETARPVNASRFALSGTVFRAGPFCGAGVPPAIWTGNQHDKASFLSSRPKPRGDLPYLSSRPKARRAEAEESVGADGVGGTILFSGIESCFDLLVFLICCLLAAPGLAGEALWEWVTPTPQGHDLFAAAIGDGVTVAVGREGMVVTRVDGGEWRTSHAADEIFVDGRGVGETDSLSRSAAGSGSSSAPGWE